MAPANELRRSVKGLSEAAFRERFGTEEACRRALFEMRWPEGLACPACGGRSFCELKGRKLFQCHRCKRQVRLTAGTVFQDTKLPLTVWFAAIYHLTQSKSTRSERPGDLWRAVTRGLPLGGSAWSASRHGDIAPRPGHPIAR